MPNATAPKPKSKDRLPIAAAALAWAPIGFVLGGMFAGRMLAAGGTIAACALLGALALAALMASVATRLPAKPLRVTTVVAGGVSFALIVFLVRDFVADRMRQAEAFDAAYARMKPFQLRVESNNPNRAPFSVLTFHSTTRRYVAQRPGGWLCQGDGRREHALALSRGLQAAARENAPSGMSGGRCATHVFWRYGNAAAASAEEAMPLEHRACAPAPLLLAADSMVQGTARRASCRRSPAAQDQAQAGGAVRPERASGRKLASISR